MVTSEEESAFMAEYSRLRPKNAGKSTQLLVCRQCGHEWISWPGSLCPIRGRHDFAPGDFPAPRIARGEG